MTSQALSEIVGKATVYALLQDLSKYESGISQTELYDLMRDSSVEDPDVLFTELLGRGLLSQYGGRYVLSTPGRHAHLLVAGLNGMTIEDVLRELRRISPDLMPYELVQEGMTAEFIRSLLDRPDFQRVYICSPWIILTDKMKYHLRQAFYAANELADSGGYETDLLCVCRPPEGSDEQKERMADSIKFLKDSLGAEIVTHKRLHSKLYIRDPAPTGGLQVAVVGSQNLTGSNNLELGIRIRNDGVLIGKLISYFMNVRARGVEAY